MILTWKRTCIKLQSTTCTSHFCWLPFNSTLRVCPALYWVKCGYGQSFRYCIMKDLWGLSGMSSTPFSTVKKAKAKKKCVTLLTEITGSTIVVITVHLNGGKDLEALILCGVSQAWNVCTLSLRMNMFTTHNMMFARYILCIPNQKCILILNR